MKEALATGSGNLIIDVDVVAQYAGSVAVDNKLILDFHVIVSYGVNIRAVASNLVNNVKYKVEEFTGFEIDKINVYVEGVRVID